MTRPKVYDRAYFDRWYRAPGTRVWTVGEVQRKVRLALSAAEYILGRPVRTFAVGRIRLLTLDAGAAAWSLAG